MTILVRLECVSFLFLSPGFPRNRERCVLIFFFLIPSAEWRELDWWRGWWLLFRIRIGSTDLVRPVQRGGSSIDLACRCMACIAPRLHWCFFGDIQCVFEALREIETALEFGVENQWWLKSWRLSKHTRHVTFPTQRASNNSPFSSLHIFDFFQPSTIKIMHTPPTLFLHGHLSLRLDIILGILTRPSLSADDPFLRS